MVDFWDCDITIMKYVQPDNFSATLHGQWNFMLLSFFTNQRQGCAISVVVMTKAGVCF